MEKKKKRIIISSIIAGVIVVVLLLSSTIFKIRSVSVEYQTTLTLLSKDELEQMVDDAVFPIGKSIFFAKFDENISSMEKSHPYAKINGVERKFPSYLVVYVSERVPVVRYETSNGVMVLDSDLKILNFVRNGEYNAIAGEGALPILKINNIPNFNLNVDGFEKGDFLNSEKLKTWVKAFYEGAVCPSTNLDGSQAISCISMIKSIAISYESELEKFSFFVEYNEKNSDNSSITSTIIGEEDLTNTIYKVITSVNHAITSGIEYEYINASGGVLYAKEKN